ncbi:M61 family metallopeptidase [Azoarcus olearius]|uniref:PDZ domain-containing protein n=1 Tax=Azoarcus sp. (strain BH72) TaxID=418699 RepID=A1K780_AZOSB|nr:PDZ domain-containing protein [Azoarcus olearius]CAL94685.1 conserved hypothetical protein [Azoarcus olearius]
MIVYSIKPTRPEAHLFEVRCEIDHPQSPAQIVRLPAWIPGSYMIREFARNIVSFRATLSEGEPLPAEKVDKHTWRIAVPRGAARIVLTYEVYAWDLSVRSAHLDSTHGFFNGTSVFLAVDGRESDPCEVEIAPPTGPAYERWRVATALPRAPSGVEAHDPHAFGRFAAKNYDDLVDHPVEMGEFQLGHFTVAGVPHEVALSGRAECDMERLTTDLQRICEWQVRLFDSPPPMDYYLFLTTVVGDGYGGLEHRASTALLASRKDLPWIGMKKMSEAYRGFLGLCSHEYFHSWNVKRIKPAVFTPYQLEQENYTRLLWAFEGFTSYYDDLTLVRAGVIEVDDYLALLSKTISTVLRGPGRLRQSVAESSFDAWIKYYRQDENSPNAIVSYYAKGSLIALALDLKLRKASGGTRSLDDVMRHLWREHGLTGVGVGEEGVFEAVEAVSGSSALARWLRDAVNGTDDLPLERLLQPFGVEMEVTASNPSPSLGVKLGGGNGEVKLAVVYDGGAAQRAGLSAGDVLVALDGIRATNASLDEALTRRRAGDGMEILAFRRDELMRFQVTLDAPGEDTVKLGCARRASSTARTLRNGWLHGLQNHNENRSN